MVRKLFSRAGFLLGACLMLPAQGWAEQIVVSNYGVAANGMPYAVALEKGFFQKEGADVSGILSSNGGGTTVRNLLGGDLAYGEIDLAGNIVRRISVDTFNQSLVAAGHGDISLFAFSHDEQCL